MQRLVAAVDNDLIKYQFLKGFMLRNKPVRLRIKNFNRYAIGIFVGAETNNYVCGLNRRCRVVL